MKKRLFIIGAVALLTMTGCRSVVTPERILKEANEKSSTAESVAMTMNMDIQAKMKMTGISIDMGINMDMDTEMTADPIMMYTTGDMSIDVMGSNEKIAMEMYGEQDGDDFITYSRAEGEAWQKEVADVGQYESVMSLYQEDALEDMVKSLELAEETETIQRIECYKLSGEVAGSQLENILGTTLSSMENNEMFGELELSDGDVLVEYYIAKADKYPVKIVIDMSNFMGEMLSEAMSGAFGDAAAEGLDLGTVEVEVDSCIVEMQYTSFDEVSEIKIPSEAKDASTQAGDSGFDETGELPDEISAQEISDIFAENAEDNETEDVEAEEVETEAVEEAAETTAAVSTGGGILEDNSVKINGQTITFPCSLDDFRAIGMEFEAEDNEKVAAQDYTFIYVEVGENFKGSMSLVVYNDSDEEKDAFDCQVGGFRYDCYSDAYKMEIDLEFQKGLQIGDPLEKAVSLYGEPNSKNIYDDYASYTWESKDSYFHSCSLTSDEDGNIVRYDFRNFDIDW